MGCDRYRSGMANRHFGKFADVWKHLVVCQVIADAKPKGYAESHAGSAAYPLISDAERRFGVLGFVESAATSPRLASAPFTRVVSEYVGRRVALYPGSALQAMTLLGDDTAYLLCDLDPASAEDLRSWAARLNLRHCEVAERDGMAAVRDWLPDAPPAVVHIDPFDPFAREDGAPSAIELASEVADAGHALVYWYGYSAPAERVWAVDQIRAATSAALWWGDVMVTTAGGAVRDDGDLGAATSAGTGCGLVLANASPGLADTCTELARELGRIYSGKQLPDGVPGGLDVVVGKST